MACRCSKTTASIVDPRDVTKSQIFRRIADKVESSAGKVTVVGVGSVGMACAVSLLLQGVTRDLALVDMDENRLKGEMLDLQHGSMYMNNAKISCSTDYSSTEGSKLVIITAGARQAEGETRIDLVHKNVAIMKNIIPEVVKYSPDCIILMVSNPCDILTWMAWKMSGFPVNRVLGAGTSLDSSRFRWLLGERLGVAASSVHAWIIGEHGDTSVALWSGVSVGGVFLRDVNPKFGEEDDPEEYYKYHGEVVQCAYEVIKYKGYTNWAIGCNVSAISKAILTNSKRIFSVSTTVKGMHGIEHDVFLSIPCILGEDGITDIVKHKLTQSERDNLHISANAMQEVQGGLDL